MAQQLKASKCEYTIPLHQSERLNSALISWFEEFGKDYPWRSTNDPYEILVSEIMLQQTQVSTVLERGYYRRWLEKFPDFESLSSATEEEVLRAWEGLGYYSRARNLHKVAIAVMNNFGGVFPSDLSLIEKLPGIGQYTAGAVASFAFNAPAPAVDANIARVLARIFEFRERIDTSHGQKQIWKWASTLVPESGGRSWNSALMELGQTLCKAKSVQCQECPVSSLCLSKNPLELPLKKSRPVITEMQENVVFALKGKKVLLERETGRRRKGMWKLPERAAQPLTGLHLLAVEKYSITRYRVTMNVYEIKKVSALENEQWFNIEELENLPMPSPYRRVLQKIIKE
ncbi:MAG: A/G-specific adenine glycosylase [Verrucomicrobiota bacterium]|nr:A/G-specific adenine glycosylase [Verrucomicrobiota bacterium]